MSEVAELQKQLELVHSEITLLQSNQCELYERLTKDLREDFAKQKQALSEWHENEKQAAQRNYNAMMTSIESEHDFYAKSCKDRAQFLIQHKVNRLIQAMPSTAAYFFDKDIPFVNNFVKPLNLSPEEYVSKSPCFSLSGTKRFHLPESDLDPPDTYSVGGHGNILCINNKKVSSGTNASLKFPQLDPIRGTIKGITKDGVDFTPSGYGTIRISMDALRYNLVSLIV